MKPVYWVSIIIVVLLFLRCSIKTQENKNEVCTKIDIDKAFVITLSTDEERYKRFMDTYKLNVPIEPIISYNTKNQEVSGRFKSIVQPEYFKDMHEYDKGMLRPDHTYFNSGALGCYIGHMLFYERCFKDNIKYGIIFEDNLVFADSFPDDVDKVLRAIGSDFELCFLHCWSHIGEKVKLCTEDDITKIIWTASTKCYIINVENMKKYYKYFFPISNHVDNVYEVIIHHGARAYLNHTESIKIQRTPSLINHVNVAVDNPFKFLPIETWKRRTMCKDIIE